jgi:hypothetical protein
MPRRRYWPMSHTAAVAGPRARACPARWKPARGQTCPAAATRHLLPPAGGPARRRCRRRGRDLQRSQRGDARGERPGRQQRRPPPHPGRRGRDSRPWGCRGPGGVALRPPRRERDTPRQPFGMKTKPTIHAKRLTPGGTCPWNRRAVASMPRPATAQARRCSGLDKHWRRRPAVISSSPIPITDPASTPSGPCAPHEGGQTFLPQRACCICPARPIAHRQPPRRSHSGCRAAGTSPAGRLRPRRANHADRRHRASRGTTRLFLVSAAARGPPR